MSLSPDVLAVSIDPSLSGPVDEGCIVCAGTLCVTAPGLVDTRFGIPGTYSVARCSSCGLEQIQPCPSQKELIQLYERYYNFGGERNSLYTRMRERFLFSPFYGFWLALDGDISFQRARGDGRLLDVGCNEGRGLTFFRQNGWQAEGLELNPAAAAVARSRGFTVHGALAEDFQPENPYDVVVLSNVLEHSLEPQEMLRHVRRLLKPSGQVWISCPNGTSLLRTVFGRNWINWHVPFHIVQFTPATIERLLLDAGFGSVAIRQETPSLWFAHSLIAALFARPEQPTGQLRNPVLVAFLILAVRLLLFPVLWYANRTGRGDCMVIRAERL